MFYIFKSSVNNTIRENTLRACLPDGCDDETKVVSWNSMRAFARLTNCKSLEGEVEAHMPADEGFRFVPTTRRILHCHSIPEWSFDLQGWSDSLRQWETKELHSDELFDLAKEHNIRNILSWERDEAKWRGKKSAFMMGKLKNKVILFHYAEHGWIHECTTQQVEFIDRGQLIKSMHCTLVHPKRKQQWVSNGAREPSLKRQMFERHIKNNL